MALPPTLGSIEEEYRRFLVAQFDRLLFKGISRTGKTISLPLEDIYVELKTVAEVPDAFDSYSAEERRLLHDAEARGRRDPELRMQLDSLRLERWRHEGRRASSRLERRSIEISASDPGRPGLVILGDPGSGKTTLLHYLALRAAKEGLPGYPRSASPPGLPTDTAARKPRLPIFVPLAAYDDWLRRSKTPVPLRDFLPIYHEVWHGLADLGPLFLAALDEGRALVLLDGLDEVLDVTTRQHVANQARQLIDEELGRGNRFVVTSRVVGYREAPLSGDLPHATVLDFEEPEIETFARKWCDALELWMTNEPELSDVARRRAATDAEALLAEVRANPSVLRLAANPLLLTMLALLRRQGGKLPDQRIKLYERYVESLLDNNWETVRSEGARKEAPDRFDQAVATDYLIELALWLQQHKPSGTARRQDIEGALIEIALRIDGVDPKLASPAARSSAEGKAALFLKDMRHFAGLLAERGHDAFGFSHLTFQEYFAGRALARLDPDDRWALLKPNLHRPRWREPLLLCAGQLGIVERRGKSVSDLGRRILTAESPHEELLHRDVLLLAAMAADNVGLDRALVDELMARLVELAEDRIPKVRREALGGLAQLARLEHEGAMTWLEDRIRRRERLDETAEAVSAVLRNESCLGLRRALAEWAEDSGWIADVATRALKPVVSMDERIQTLVLEKLDADYQWDCSAALEALEPLIASNPEVRHRILAMLDSGDLVEVDAAFLALRRALLDDHEARRHVLRMLGHAHRSIRRAAVMALGPLVGIDAEVRSAVLGLLEEPFDIVRASAVSAIQSLVSSDEEARRLVCSKAEDPSAGVRWAVIEALGSLVWRNAEVRRLVLERVDDVDADVRRAALEALQPIASSDEDVRHVLLSKLDDQSWPVLHWMIHALSAAIPGDAKAAQLILQRIDDPDWRVRVAVVEALAPLSMKDVDVRLALSARLGDPDEDVRAASVKALAPLAVTDANTRGLLLDKLEDEDARVCREVVAALAPSANGEERQKLLDALLHDRLLSFLEDHEPFAPLVFGDEVARDLLLTRLEHDSMGVRYGAIRLLGAVAPQDADVRSLLVERLDDEDLTICQAAIDALAPIAVSCVEVRLAFQQRANDPDCPLRAETLSALGAAIAIDTDVRRLAIACLSDPNPYVRGAAVNGLGKDMFVHDDILPLILARLDDEEGIVRAAAVSVLVPVVPNDRKIHNVVRDKLEDEEFVVRRSAVYALTPLLLEDAALREKLLPWLGIDTHEYLIEEADPVRRHLASYFARLISEEPDLRIRILEMLGSPAWPARMGAAWTFCAMPGGPPADVLPRLYGLLEDSRGEESWPERLHAAAALINDRDRTVSRRAIARACEALDHAIHAWYNNSYSTGAPKARAQAATVLGNLEPTHRDDAVFARLIRVLTEEQYDDVLDAAYQALLRIAEAPEPLLPPGAGVEPDSDRLQAPTIERIAIRNFKNLDHLEITFAKSPTLEGHWTCIAGINGAGKSAVLQAIALVLLGEDLAGDIGSDWLKRMRRRAGDESHEALLDATIRHGNESRTLFLALGDTGVNRAEVGKHPQHAAMRSFWGARDKRYILAGYGAGRNLSERTSQDDGKSPEARRLMSLFEPLTPLPSAEALIRDKRELAPALTLLRRLLHVVLEGTGLAVTPDPSALRFSVEGTVVPPTDLPDGFRATVAWLADLCATWYDRAPEEALTGEPERMRGIVLIDEIDLHLHPRLQRVLVPRLRKALPRIQWIVTTHSPLILSSFDRHEIVALDARLPGRKRGLDRQILGFSPDEVYEWLMDTEPRSAALDERFAKGNGVGAETSLILAQSPHVSEEEAEENRAFRQRLARRLEEQARQKGQGGSGAPGRS